MELQGLRWLLQGRDVHLVSTALNTRAIHIHIEHQLNMMVRLNMRLRLNMMSECGPPATTPGTVHRHEYDFMKKEEDVERAVDKMSECAKDGTLHMLMDEANFTASAPDGKPNQRLVTELARRLPDLHLWAARIGYRDVPPDLTEEKLTFPLRSPPSVQREVEKALCVYDDITKYNNKGVPSPADGLEVIRLSHHGDGHNGLWPDDCEQCGHNVAAELLRLHVGATEPLVKTSTVTLRYSDVFVLTRSTDLHDHYYTRHGWLCTASHFVLGLRAKGLPVCVLGRPDVRHDRERWERDLADIAIDFTDRVTVAYWADVQGLERPVVVLLPGRRGGSDERNSKEKIGAQDLLAAASRAMAQLIVVEVPGPTVSDYLWGLFYVSVLLGLFCCSVANLLH